MKPFDLEAAKCGEWIQSLNKGEWEEASFIGVDGCGDPVVHTGGVAFSTVAKNLRMAPQKRTVWVNLYLEPREASWYDSEYLANMASKGSQARIGDRAWSLEFEE